MRRRLSPSESNRIESAARAILHSAVGAVHVRPGLAHLAGTRRLPHPLVALHHGDTELPPQEESPFGVTSTWLSQPLAYGAALGIDVDDGLDIAERTEI